ncbi:3-dehydroquinate dehydratase (3-dehydroquinase), partial [Physocladia obscura]
MMNPNTKNSEKATTIASNVPESTVPIHTVQVLGINSVTLGYGIAGYVATQIVTLAPASTFLIGTDSNIAGLHLDSLKHSLQLALNSAGSNTRVLTYVVPPGES